ncbi:MAG: oligopeptidase [Phycisphaerae bacterium]
MSKVEKLPKRSQIKPRDQWDLTPLFASDTAWEKAFVRWEKQIRGYEKHRGRLADSPTALAAALKFDADLSRAGERLGSYAFLRASEDQANSEYQRMRGRFEHGATRAAEAGSFIRPEIMAIPKRTMDRFMKSRELAAWRFQLAQIVRYRPHTLSRKEEHLLAMQGQMSEASNQIFRQLTDADLKWELIRDEKGRSVELSHATFSVLLHSPSRRVREEAFHKYYRQFETHCNTLAASLNASAQRDVYYARARNFNTAREAALFADRVPASVYDHLIASVHRALPAVYRYFDIRRRKMKLRDIHHYDTYVPILSGLQKHHTWDQAVRTVIDALEPLGGEYTQALEQGLTTSRWCDRYPNQGKQSGAFSGGGYDGPPYILMNYQPAVLDHIFTLAHEAGHSMHTWYAARHQPFQYYGYSIFVAEVASTFNEQLLLRHLLDKTTHRKERAYLINHAVDEIRGTIIRQTMFAEFENVSHALVEAGEPLTVERVRAEYRKLLDTYFGPDFTLDQELELECLRIPHFYRAFYVYKYATGLSAAIALSQRVLNGGARELADYLGFLKGGSSKYPLDLLRGAGVDMEQPQAVDAAMGRFAELVEELDELL